MLKKKQNNSSSTSKFHKDKVDSLYNFVSTLAAERQAKETVRIN